MKTLIAIVVLALAFLGVLAYQHNDIVHALVWPKTPLERAFRRELVWASMDCEHRDNGLPEWPPDHSPNWAGTCSGGVWVEDGTWASPFELAFARADWQEMRKFRR